VEEKYGPLPTPEISTPEAEIFKGTPPPGYASMNDFLADASSMLNEIVNSSAEAKANCAGQQVCVNTSLGPV
jgi:hypothetical protein